MKNKGFVLFLILLFLLLTSGFAQATTVTFSVADIKAAIGSLHDATYQWGLWAVRVRPVVTGGSFTFTSASTTQEGWGVEAPSTHNWTGYGTDCVWFFDESGAESAGTAANPLYMIMDVEASTFWSAGFDQNGAWVADWAPGPDGVQGTGDDLGTFLDSGYDNGAGGTNIITSVDALETFSFDFTLDSGSWSGQLEFLVDGSKYNLGTAASPQAFVENFFGGYGDGGGLTGNTGDGYLLSLPAADEVWVDDNYTEASHGGHDWGYNAFATIQEGIDAVEEGGTVNVAAGTYTDDIWDSGLGVPDGYRIKKSVTLLGAHSGNDPEGSLDRGEESVLVRTNGVPYSLYVSDITIDGFTFTSGGGSGGGRLIVGDASDHTIITNCILKDISGTDPHGIYVYPGAQDTLISQNTLSNTGWEALNIDGAAIISGNVIKDIPSNKGIRIGPASNTTVTENIISNAFYEGIASFGTTTITDNEISGCSHGIQLRGNATAYTVSGNNIHHNQYHGIEVPNYTEEVVTSFDIANNILSNNPYCGVKVGGNTDGIGYHINNNTIQGNGIYGVESATTEKIDATHNWWGHESGPHHEATNPDGTGDKVSDNVLYYHWYADDGLTTLYSANAITLTKTGPASAKKGDEITYTIEYKNESNFNETNLVITETYPSEVEFISSNPAPDTGTNNKWTIDTLEADGEGTIEITVKIK